MVDIPVFISAVSSAYPAKITRLTPKIAKIFACGAILSVSNGTKLDYFTAHVNNLYKETHVQQFIKHY